jgi:hypothetical protein
MHINLISFYFEDLNYVVGWARNLTRQLAFAAQHNEGDGARDRRETSEPPL